MAAPIATERGCIIQRPSDPAALQRSDSCPVHLQLNTRGLTVYKGAPWGQCSQFTRAPLDLYSEIAAPLTMWRPLSTLLVVTTILTLTEATGSPDPSCTQQQIAACPIVTDITCFPAGTQFLPGACCRSCGNLINTACGGQNGMCAPFLTCQNGICKSNIDLE